MGSNKPTVKILHSRPLGEHYVGLNDTAKRELKHLIVLRLGVSEATVYRWVRGTAIPRKAEAVALGELTGIAPTELYPQLFILDNINN